MIVEFNPDLRPSSAQVRLARMRTSELNPFGRAMTQPRAAATVGVRTRTWQNWEAGVTPMKLSHWKVFLREAGLLPESDK